MTHPGFTRNYESTLALLAERGHRIHLAFDGPPQVGKPSAVDGLEARFPSVTHGAAPDRDDVWSPLVGASRALRNALRYLHPRYRAATRLRERAVVWPLGPVLAAVAALPVGGQVAIHLLDLALRGVERIVPSSREIERFIREHAPDAVLLTPVVDFNTPQTDQLKSARALGLPTGVCVASWDNLTNKGLIQVRPDLLTVWNERQRREAVELHDIPAERVAVTGAQIFDEWFVRQPTTSRIEFCEQLGLPADRPLLLYACSSQWIAPHEAPFVERWLRAIRSGPEPLASAAVLVRPHPQNAAQWQHADLSAFGPATVWPRDPSARVDSETKAGFYDSLFHSVAIVGINTSAMIEAGIVGRPVFSILDPEHRNSQEGTLHFRYLVEESGGLLQVADGLPAHVEQLAAALSDRGHAERARAFLAAFVRPRGLDRPSTPILADALEGLGRMKTAPDRTPLWARLARPALFGVAVLARLIWDALKRRRRHASRSGSQDVSFGRPAAVSASTGAPRSAAPR
ncbi:MAG: hypothetical protein IT306_26835 [Chloroflexi bacterium]|nr:hypothetical protein [Chloroflexota bacterium]